MSDNPTVKLSKNPTALAFLKKHSKDSVIGGGLSACLPYHNYTKVLTLARKTAVDAVTEAFPFLSVKEQRLAELFLRIPPREIARQLGLKRSVLYDQLRALRAKALRIVADRREGLINQRSAELTPDGLDARPADIAIRTLRFTLHERVAHAYLIARDDTEVWVDETGQAFGPEIQDILSNVEEDLTGEAVLEVEKIG